MCLKHNSKSQVYKHPRIISYLTKCIIAHKQDKTILHAKIKLFNKHICEIK